MISFPPNYDFYYAQQETTRQTENRAFDPGSFGGEEKKIESRAGTLCRGGAEPRFGDFSGILGRLAASDHLAGLSAQT